MSPAVMSLAHRRLVDDLIVVCNYLRGNCKDYGTKLFLIGPKDITSDSKFSSLGWVTMLSVVQL